MTGTAFAYDVVDYPTHVYPQLHPSRLAAIARLHGVAAASPRECRLLEVGCGEGLQLLALAMAYPHGRFVGVDLSANAIARGEAMRARLGLDNLQLLAMDLLEWDPGPDAFDYIVAHGFYSWVPTDVRERLMRLCAASLADGGIACVTYNTLPGCHQRRMLWEIMRFHSEGAADPGERIARALECLDLLELGMPAGKRFTAMMSDEIRDLRDRLHPGVLFHDDLAGINDPVTLDAFVRHARGHGLEFVAEASYHEMALHNAGEQARPILAEIAVDDPVTKEQYLDFFTGRRFRQTLLCRRHARPRPHAAAGALAGLEIVGNLAADPEGADAEGRLHFSHPDSGGLATDDPVFQAAIARCAEQYPQPQPFAGLLDHARGAAASANGRDEDAARLQALLLRAFEAGILELHCDAPRFAAEAPARPAISPLVRLLLETGNAQAPNLRPRMVEIPADPAIRALLRRLDGHHEHAALLAACEGDGMTGERLQELLRELARMALLLGEAPAPADQRTR